MSQQINLYNPRFRKQEKHFSARAMLQALGAIALGLAALYGHALVQTRSAEQSAAELRDRAAAERERLAKLVKGAPQARSSGLEADVARLEAQVKARQQVLAALGTGQLGNAKGFSDFMAAFGRQALPGVWLTGFDIGEAGNELNVRGRVLHPELVPAYLRALNNEPMMRGRRVVELKLAARSAGRMAPGAAPEDRPLEPERFVEFAFAAPLRPGEVAAPAKGATP